MRYLFLWFVFAVSCLPQEALQDKLGESKPMRVYYPLRTSTNARSIEDKLTAASKLAISSTSRITYHGGAVMTGPVTVYYIWYGGWNGNTAITLLEGFLTGLSGSSYYAINSTYTDGANIAVNKTLLFGGSYIDNYSRGKDLDFGSISGIVKDSIAKGNLPNNPNGIYMVLTSDDVSLVGFCTSYCAWHSAEFMFGSTIKIGFVGNPTRCPASCSMQSSPNGNPSADGMASIIAHEISATVTNPELSGWYDNDFKENADKCVWTFGTERISANGSRANLNLNGKDFLVQQNWVNLNDGFCAMQFSLPVLNAVNPTNFPLGATTPVVLTGTNFGNDSVITISGTGVQIANQQVISTTQLNASVVVSPTALSGTRSITVSSSMGPSAPLSINVGIPTITVSSVTPNKLQSNTATLISIEGTNFAPGVSVTVGDCCLVSNVIVTSPTRITAQLIAYGAAPAGIVNLVVSIGSSKSVPLPITITNQQIATLVSISPSSGVPGSATTVTLTGTNFTAESIWRILGDGITASNFVFVSPTQLRALLTISQSASLGARSIFVSTGSTSTAATTFIVSAPTAFFFREDFETFSNYDYVQPLQNGVVLSPLNAPLWPPGTYTVAPNPQAVHPLFCAFGDHTTGSSLMLVANGRGGAIESVWSRTVSGLNVGTTYRLSAWAALAYHESPPIFRFTVDGRSTGQPLALPVSGASCPTKNSTPVWQLLTVTFTAQSTQVTINLQDINLNSSGNDFAIDDISLVPESGGQAIFVEDFEVSSNYKFVAPLLPGLMAAVGTAPLWNEGTYTIASNPQTTHPLFCSFGGNGGVGKMLVANGTGGGVASVWSRKISGLLVGRQYSISVWAASVYESSPAVLRFVVAGQPVGQSLTPSVVGASCPAKPASPLWRQLVVSFTAAATWVEIELQNVNLAKGGNDFAIDDIEVTLNPMGGDDPAVVHTTAIAGPKDLTVTSPEFQLDGSQSFSDNDQALEYLWSIPQGGLSAAILFETSAMPIVQFSQGRGRYTFQLKVTDSFGKTSVDVVTVDYR